MRRTPRVALPLALTALLLAVIAGCWRPETPLVTPTSGAPAPTTPLAATTTTTAMVGPTAPTVAGRAPATATPGGSLTVAMPGAPTTLNPVTKPGADAATAAVMARVLPCTFRSNGDGALELDPASPLQAAPEIVNRSPFTVRYFIRSGANWSDGKPITSDDFIWNAEIRAGTGPLATPGRTDIDELPFNVASTEGYERIRRIVRLSDKAFEVEFDEPYAEWPLLWSCPEGVVPRHVAQELGWNYGLSVAGTGTTAAWAVSGGPFRVRSFTPGREVVLERNPSFWGAPANLERLTVRFGADEAALLELVAQGQADLAAASPSADVVDLVGQGRLAGQRIDGPDAYHLTFNTRSPSVQEEAVRLAIATAVDTPELVDAILGPTLGDGQRPLCHHLLVRSQPGYEPHCDAYGTGNGSRVTAIMNDAGYTLGTDGVWTKGGAPVRFHLTTAVSDSVAVAVVGRLRDQLRQAGFDVVIDNAPDGGQVRNRLLDGNFDLVLAPWAVTDLPGRAETRYTEPVRPPVVGTTTSTGAPPTTAAGVSTTAAGGTSTSASTTTAGPTTTRPGQLSRVNENYSRWSGSAPVAQKFVQWRREADASRATQIVHDIDKDLWRGMPSLPLVQRSYVVVQRPGLVNVPVAASGRAGLLWDAEHLGRV